MMALSADESADFKWLVARLGAVSDGSRYDLDGGPGGETVHNLRRLVLAARDEFDDDETYRLLSKYSGEPVTNVSHDIRRACRRVCKITNGRGPFTGVLVAPDLVLTVMHMMHGARTFAHPKDIKVSFDEFRFVDDNKIHSVPVNVQTMSLGKKLDVLACSKDDELDYVLFRLESPIGLSRLGTSPRRYRGWMDLSTVEVGPEGRVLVLQHPGGSPLRVSEGDVDPNTAHLLPGRFSHNAETDPGASGSPVLNQARQLVGLHVKEKAGIEELVSLTDISVDLVRQRICLPIYPPAKSFTDQFLNMMLSPQLEGAFT